MTFAGATPRAGALIADLLIACALAIATALAAELLLEARPRAPALGVMALYFIVLPATRLQGTPGKRMNGLKITTLAGERIGIARSALRFAASLASWATAGLGFVACFWNPRRRTLHDYVAGTVVVPVKATAAQIASASPPPVPWGKRILGSLALALAIALPLFFFLEGMNARRAWELNAGNQKAVEPVVAAIERHRAAHGRFPARLADLGVQPPKLHERTALYYAASPGGDRCWLAIVYWLRPGMLPSDDVREYDCAAREWRVKDYGEMKASREAGF